LRISELSAEAAGEGGQVGIGFSVGPLKKAIRTNIVSAPKRDYRL